MGEQYIVRVAAIVAMAENRVIGIQNRLPWSIPEDLRHFKELTMSKPIIMGRRTFESIGKPLSGRTNIVVTRRDDWSCDGVVVAHTLASALEKGRILAAKQQQREVMIIGGEEIYRQALPLLDTLYVTCIHEDVDGDAVFPPVSWQDWDEVESSSRLVNEKSGLEYSYQMFRRKVRKTC